MSWRCRGSSPDPGRVTTVEIKSGYGLTLADELKMLRVARRLGEALPIRVKTTLLAAHAVPPEYRDDPDSWVETICQEIIPAAAEAGLADAVDVSASTSASPWPRQSRSIWRRIQYNLAVKGHMEQLSNLGGSRSPPTRCPLGGSPGVSGSGRDPGAAHRGVVATLLPTAFYFLKETKLRGCRSAQGGGAHGGLPDINPGTAPIVSFAWP